MSAVPGSFAIATFHSTHMVLKAEKLLKEAGLEGCGYVPVPSQVSSDCGVTVRFAAAEVARAAELLRALEDDLRDSSRAPGAVPVSIDHGFRARGDGGSLRRASPSPALSGARGSRTRHSPFGLERRARVSCGNRFGHVPG